MIEIKDTNGNSMFEKDTNDLAQNFKDASIVAGAIAAKADYLVSYDRKHLLHQKQKINDNFKEKIVTPNELIK